MAKAKRVIICGGGVIGACIAYFLARRGAEVTIVERRAAACAASGKSGGFLALDWCDGTPLQALARRSFALHAELAGTLGNTWHYRRMTTYSGALREGRGSRGAIDLGWVAPEVALDRRLGTAETTAQVHPGDFTRAMVGAAEDHGAELRIATVEGLAMDGGRLAGVVAGGETIAGDAVVIAMGPWSILASTWLPLPGVYGLKGHSLVFDTGDRVPADALFLDYREAGGGAATPEVFPRSDGTTYVCGVSSETALPVDPANVAADPGALERLEAMCAAISPELTRDRIVRRQACFRPVTGDGLPLIGAVPGVAGAYVATGHSVWGILNAPATGEAMAELILDGQTRHLDIERFAPSRLAAFDAQRLRYE